jgi:hypothetical protein
MMEGAPRIATAADPVFALMEQVEALKARIDEMEERHAKERAADRKRIGDLERANEDRGLDIASDRRRITQLETPAPDILAETSERHINKLFYEMRRRNIHQVCMKDAAHLMELSVSQAKKLKPLIGEDRRFTIIRDTSHKQRHLIRLI